MYPDKSTDHDFKDTLSKFGIFFVFASLLYQVTLCFTNTHIFQINKGLFMLVEIVLIGSGYALFAKKMHPGCMLFVILIITNALFLSLFKGHFDPKFIRDFLIPVLMLWLGLNYNHRIETDKLVAYCAILVIAVGFFELFFVDAFQKIFDVAHYQIAIGINSERSLDYRTNMLSLNSVRYGGRNLLAFLGDHRISSVFLETVNMGNFGVLVASWGLSKNIKDKTQWKNIAFFWGMGFLAALLADARFGVTMIIGLTLLRVILPTLALKRLSYFSPLFVIALTILVYFTIYEGYGDDFKSRLGLSGYYFAHFTIAEYFGIAPPDYRHFVDSGYAYAIFNNGLVFCTFSWIMFCRLKPVTESGIVFKSLIGIFLPTLLAISGSSVFALKFNALLWFLLGTLLTVYEKKNSPLTDSMNAKL
jgi:putative polymerase